MTIKIGAYPEKGPHWIPVDVRQDRVDYLLARGQGLELRQDKPDGTVLYLTGDDAMEALKATPEQCSYVGRGGIDEYDPPPPPPPRIHPPGATHVTWTYGAPCYYKRVEETRLNQVSEECQILTQWLAWDFKTEQWTKVEPGFCSRRLNTVETWS